jgi:hypothetical protein
VKRFLLSSIQLLGVWLAIFAVLAIVVEAGSRIMFPYVPPSPWDYRSSRPLAYENASYFSQAFIDEAFSHQNWINPQGTRIIYPGDYDGRWFNVKDGIRRTVEAPPAKRRILLIGSSTVYNAEVPDELTIASRLQNLVNTRRNGQAAVLNIGASGVKASQQLERLKTLQFGPGDTIVFYDGTSDAMQGVFYANFDGWIVGENRKHLDNFIARNRLKIESLARYSRLFNKLYVQSTNYLPEHLKHPEQLKALAEDSRNKFLAVLMETDAYIRSKGAVFVHVLQPDLFTRPLRDFELPLVENHFLTMNGIGIALRVAHEEFSSLTPSLVSRSVNAFDATRLFDKIDAPIYLDFAHTNELGNKLIADFLFDALTQSGALTED